MSKQIEPFFTVTSEMVLTELFNALAGKGGHFRNASIKLNKQLFEAAHCEIVPQTSLLYRDAVNRYENRPDKEWGLTDCASFIIMDEKRITEALTYDLHFVQAGFQALLRD